MTMSINDCENVQTALAESDLRHISRELASHVDTCPACTAYLERLQRLQDDLTGLGGGEVPNDALDALVQNTFRNITSRHNAEAPPANPVRYNKWASGFAVLFVCFGVVMLLQQYNPLHEKRGIYSEELSGIASKSKPPAKTEEIPMAEEEKAVGNVEGNVKGNSERNVPPSILKRISQMPERTNERQTKKEARKEAHSSGVLAFREAMPMLEGKPTLSAPAQPQSQTEVLRDEASDKKRVDSPRPNIMMAPPAPPSETESMKPSGAGVRGMPENFSAPVGGKYEFRRDISGQESKNKALAKVIAKHKPKPQIAPPAETGRLRIAIGDDTDTENKTDADKSSNTNTEAAQQIAADYLRELNRIDKLNFQPATGYWANTYLPGDPNMRLLQARLSSWDRSEAASVLNGDASLEKTASAFHQPFDTPGNSALAVYLQSDHSAVQGPTRLRVQVGLQATERFSGNRPAMNVGIVVDATGIGADALTSVKALLRAMAQSAQPGDRFSLTVAGGGGGVWIKPQEFRLGQVQVALDKLLKTQEGPGMDVATPLLDALHEATEVVQQYDDPSAVLGSSSIMLITASSLSNNIEQLEALAHRNATNGITLSVFPLGNAVNIEDVDRLVLNGQGHRRILSAPEEATQLVTTELLASSRAVARAVRLRIRLAPGVKLVQVLGSHPLDEPQAQRVREAEQSIDQRLSRNFGITADRGQDEEGIQIVIPGFYAGDSHVILLDVVAQGPGSIADVTVRYKDLLYMRNEVARANLNLPAGENRPGVLEYKVTKNLLGLTLSQHARRAADLLANGDTAAAIKTLQFVLELYKGMRHIIPNWYEDQELIKDENLLSRYLSLLQSADMRDQTSYIVDSLRLSGYRKQLNSNDSVKE